MDEIHDFIKNLKFENALVGGFDKESVYKTLKDLVTLFEEQFIKLQEENNKLKKTMTHLQKESLQDTHHNDIDDMKQIVFAYRKLQKMIVEYQNILKEKDIIIRKLKAENKILKDTEDDNLWH